eukprot:1972257-Pyramimonas_sp.AAC.1
MRQKDLRTVHFVPRGHGGARSGQHRAARARMSCKLHGRMRAHGHLQFHPSYHPHHFRAILAAPQPWLASYACARSWTCFLAAAARTTSRFR